MITVAVYDAKPYDRKHLPVAAGASRSWRFLDFRLTRETASAALGAQAVCVFFGDLSGQVRPFVEGSVLGRKGPS